ncbi:MAG: hypothetical protein ABI520_16060 [Caldimonas sp.]
MSDSSRSRRHRAAFVDCLTGLALLIALTAPIAQAAVSRAEQLRQQVTAIDERTKSQAPLRERPLQGFAAEGARVVAWGTPGAIEKISVEGLGERGRTFLDFYWRRGQLVAAHVRRVDYGANIRELPKDPPPPMNVVEEEWLEFAGDRLLRWRQLDRDMPLSDGAARKRAAELRADARSFRRLMQAPDPAAAPGGSCFWSCAREQRGECLRYSCR